MGWVGLGCRNHQPMGTDQMNTVNLGNGSSSIVETPSRKRSKRIENPGSDTRI